jgi:hypothetical protein
MLRMGTVTWLPEHEPLRPPISPQRRVVVLRRGTAGQADYREDWGVEGWFPARFVSTDRAGFLTAAQVTALRSLYQSGATFSLETDLLKPHGSTPDLYAAFFDPQTEPLFSPATPDGTLFFHDIVLLVS